ncbi:MAG: HD domain-containing protein [Clostridia bacterium]|nr:HD domain-containing protein [Clostridia bacterium]
MNLPDFVIEYLKRYIDCGFSAYVVGGAVRDSLRGVKPFDYDVATNARSCDIKRIFSDCRIIETGLKHGTLTVIFKDNPIETTTFRVDGKYLDNRHPETVGFTDDIKKDLARRDFTVNALAVSFSGEIIDLFGGVDDISRGVIRAVGNPEKRFDEDALRIIRAVRFAAVSGFTIEDKTFSAMLKKKDNLSFVSKERVFSEMTGILSGDHAEDALLKYKEIIFAVIPVLKKSDGFDQKSLSHFADLYAHTARVVGLVKDKNPVTVWAALLHDSGKPFTFVVDSRGFGHFPDHMNVSADIAEKILKEFKAPNELIKNVSAVIRIHDDSVGRTEYETKKLLNTYGAELLSDIITLKFADIYAHSETGIQKYLQERIDLKNNYDEILKSGKCYSLSQLAINGDDLINLGFKGAKVGEILSFLLDEVMKNDQINDKNKLIEIVRKNYECKR